MTCKIKTKQLRWLAAMLMLVAAMVMPSTAWAETMYTVFDTETGTLTFKYDSSKPETSTTQMVYEVGDAAKTPTWITNHASSITKVVFDESFKNARPTTCYDWFNGCKQLTEIEHLDYLNTESVQNMEYMFRHCSSLTSLDVSKFNTQNVTNMDQMFYGCSSLTSLDVSKFNTQIVSNMGSMFTGCSSLTSLDVSNFDTQKVTDMSQMFFECSSLISLDVSKFDTQKVTDMSQMFYKCNRLKVIFVSDKFDVLAVTKSTYMFYLCANLKGAVAYNSGNSNDKTYANYTNGYFTNVSEKENFCFHAVYNSSSYTLTFKYGNKTKLDTNETAYELNTGETAPGWISNTGITKVVFDYSFNYTQPTSCFQWFKGLSSLTTIEGIGYLNTSEVTTMKEMFSGCSNLTSLQLKTFNTAKVTDMTKMFYNCSSLISIYASDLFDVTQVTTSEDMFSGCTSLYGYDAGKVTKDYANSETGYFTHVPEGEGSQQSPFLIKTASDLVWFRDHVNAGNTTACARLEANINMSSVCHPANQSEGVAELSWVPISDNSKVGSKYWYGTFDGNNKTLSNLYINTSAKYSGLFGYIYNMNASERGTIKNIKFENVSLTSTAEDLGVLAGYARNTDISGITVNNGTVNGTESCGGIVGYTEDSSLSCCINKIVFVGGSSIYTGGIVGNAQSGSITNCANYGNVKGCRKVGGIAGSADVTIENVFSSGNVTCMINTSSAYTGLVVGGISQNVTISGNVIYNSEAKLSYGTTEQATKAFGRISSYSTVTESDATGMSKERLASGEVCYLLNGSSPYGAWGQQIDVDDYPVPGSPYKLITTAYKKEDGTYWATFSDLTTDVTLSVPSDRTLKVYNATVSAGTMTLSERDENQVAKGEGVLLKTDGEYVNVKANESNGLSKVEYANNNLVATPSTAGPVGGDANYTLYRLTYNTIQNEDNLGFYLGVATVNGTTYKDGSYVNATPGKAYLKVATATVTKPSGASIRGFVFPGDDGETTGIECITVTDESSHRNAEGIFDLQGRKVSKPTKGVYIKNNKLFLK